MEAPAYRGLSSAGTVYKQGTNGAERQGGSMSRAKRIVLAALMVGLMAQGAGAAEGVSHGSWFESVVQAIVSLFGGSDVWPIEEPFGPSNLAGEEPELGNLVDPFG